MDEIYHIFKTWWLGGMEQEALVVFKQIARVREYDAVAHLASGARWIMVDRHLQDLLNGDVAAELWGRRKDGVKDSTSKLCALSVQAAKYTILEIFRFLVPKYIWQIFHKSHIYVTEY